MPDRSKRYTPPKPRPRRAPSQTRTVTINGRDTGRTADELGERLRAIDVDQLARRAAIAPSSTDTPYQVARRAIDLVAKELADVFKP